MSTRRIGADIFEGRVAVRLALVFGVAVAVALFFSLTAEEPAPTTTIPSAYSRSAIGYEALAESLQESGMRVLISRWHSGKRARADTPVLALEPMAEHTAQLTELLAEASERSAPVVVGLPKWSGRPSGNGWVREVELRPTADAADVLSILSGESLPASAVYHVEDESTSCSASQLPASPDIPHSLQLIDGSQLLTLKPVITCGSGVLVGWLPYGATGSIWVVSDPDLWNTHGLAKAANPEVVEGLLRDGLGAQGVIIDETVHGFEHPPSIWQELTTFPLSLFSAHLVGLFLLSVLAAAARFGAPQPLPPRIPPGKGALIENTARLLDMGSHRAYTVSRYFDATIRRLAVAVSLPPGLSRAQQVERLEQHYIHLGLASRPATIYKQTLALPEKNCSTRRALALAHRIRAMRAELIRSPHAD